MSLSHRAKRPGVLETEIEKAREESQWKKVIDLAQQLKDRPDQARQHETLGWFLIGEGKLEEYLEEFPPLEENIKEAKSRLREAKACLERTIGEEAKKLGVHLDSWILLAKLHYSMGNYSDSLKYYEKAQIESLEEKHLPTRSLKIMAEAFAIKGHCYEKLPLQTTSKHKLVDREAKVLKCYEVAGDLTLLYLQVRYPGPGAWYESLFSGGGQEQQERTGPVDPEYDECGDWGRRRTSWCWWRRRWRGWWYQSGTSSH